MARMPTGSRRLEPMVTSYRRGFKNGEWDRYWHWNDECREYPTGTCVMRKDRPPDELLCLRCLALERPG
jgi:hypothetical protein